MRTSFQIASSTKTSSPYHKRTSTFEIRRPFNSPQITEYQIPFPTIPNTMPKDPPLSYNRVVKPSLNKEFLKELTKIYDSNSKTSRTSEEYEAFFRKEAKKLVSNLKSINSLARKEVGLSRDCFFSEEDRLLMKEKTISLLF